MQRRIAYIINHMDVGFWGGGGGTHLVLERQNLRVRLKNRVCGVSVERYPLQHRIPVRVLDGYFVSAHFFMLVFALGSASVCVNGGGRDDRGARWNGASCR